MPEKINPPPGAESSSGAQGPEARGGARRGRRARTRRESEPAEIPAGVSLVIVQFKGHRKSYYNNRLRVPVEVGDYCLVEADRGRDLGQATYVGSGKPRWWREATEQGVLALARAEDLARLHENRADEWEFFDLAREKIQARRLPMELVSVERRFDRNKITFYFTADKRVDFRELVKDLAAVFRTRIELRQIGVRDEARLQGGLGLCGRELCCSSFLDDFAPVTLKMAKEQQLPLSPIKLSGLCGRLRCCLAFEHADYLAAQSRLPRIGATVAAAGRAGVVRKLDLVRELVTVFFSTPEPAETAVLPAASLQWDRAQDLPSPRAQSARGCGGKRH